MTNKQMTGKSNLVEGYKFEAQIAKILSKYGKVVRSPGSRGLFDLQVFQGNRILLVNIKNNGYWCPAERKALAEYKPRKNEEVWLAYRDCGEIKIGEMQVE